MADVKPDITDALLADLREAVMARCDNDDHFDSHQACGWCDPFVAELHDYAVDEAKRIREKRTG